MSFIESFSSEGSFPWDHLPSELQNIILKLVSVPSRTPTLADVDRAGIRPRVLPRVAKFASVCRSWQPFFEAQTLCRLVVSQHDLTHLDKALKGVSFMYLEHIWLHLSFDVYDRKQSMRPEDEDLQLRQESIADSSVSSLIRILSQCSREIAEASNMTLELSAVSPSDTQYKQYFCEMEENYPWVLEEDLKTWPCTLASYHHLSPMSLSERSPNHRTLMATPKERRRIQGSELDFTGSALCKAPAVKHFVIRRHCHRRWPPSALAFLMVWSLRWVKTIRWERWILQDLEWEALNQDQINGTFLQYLPPSLESLSLMSYDNSDDELAPGRVLEPIVTRAMATWTAVDLCGSLTEFCPPAGLVRPLFNALDEDALTPKDDRPKLCANPKLRRLVIPNFTGPKPTYASITAALCQAARVATRFHELEMMEMFAVTKSWAFIFRYSFLDDRPKVEWFASDRSALDITVTTAWNKMVEDAEKIDRHRLTFQVSSVAKDSCGAGLYKTLKLRRLAFDAVTEEQLAANIGVAFGAPVLARKPTIASGHMVWPDEDRVVWPGGVQWPGAAPVEQEVGQEEQEQVHLELGEAETTDLAVVQGVFTDGVLADGEMTARED